MSLSSACFSSASIAAGKCSVVRTESTFELINSPVEEMRNSRNSTAINCVFIKDFIARSQTRPVPSIDPPRNTPTANGAYVPKTKDDNTPWRFDMNQNGKRMTSEEFDAWMKAKGIRVATGKPGAETAPPPPPVECTPSKQVKC
ncbi:MAG: hypothetical protein ACREPB_11830 [Arenimonas sp.]